MASELRILGKDRAGSERGCRALAHKARKDPDNPGRACAPGPGGVWMEPCRLQGTLRIVIGPGPGSTGRKPHKGHALRGEESGEAESLWPR